MGLAFGVVGVVGVRDPISGLTRVARAVALARRGVALLAVAEEVHAVERFGADPAAQVHKLMRADAVGLLAAPNVVAHPGPLVRRADSFAPLVVTAEQPAEAEDAGREVLSRGNEVAPPVVTIVVPRRLDRRIGDPQRLHELHVKPGRDVEQRLWVEHDGAAGLAGFGRLRLRGRGPRLGAGYAARQPGAVLKESPSLHQ